MIKPKVGERVLVKSRDQIGRVTSVTGTIVRIKFVDGAGRPHEFDRSDISLRRITWEDARKMLGTAYNASRAAAGLAGVPLPPFDWLWVVD
jgi:hypothetical protein